MHPIEIYGQDGCVFCEKAKTLATDNRYPVMYRDIVNPALKQQMMDRCPVRPRTVPQIFIGRRHIGGYTELLLAHHDGSLAQMMAGF